VTGVQLGLVIKVRVRIIPNLIIESISNPISIPNPIPIPISISNPIPIPNPNRLPHHRDSLMNENDRCSKFFFISISNPIPIPIPISISNPIPIFISIPNPNRLPHHRDSLMNENNRSSKNLMKTGHSVGCNMSKEDRIARAEEREMMMKQASSNRVHQRLGNRVKIQD
jgi:hypothetical protein